MKNTSNNFVAGLFVIGGVTGFVLIVLLLSGVRLWGGSQVPYTVRFTLEQGASGLKPGSLVRVGGQRAGAVTSVQYMLDASTQSPMAVDVVVGLDASIVLFKDAMPQLELPLLGTVSTLNISFTGTPGAGRLERGGTLTGMIALPPFMSQAGFGNEQRAQVQQIIRGGAALISDGQRLFTRLNTESDPLLRDITESVANVKRITADIQARVGDWSPKITSTLTNAENISADIEGSRKLLDDGLSRARELIDTAQAVVRDNRPRIDSTIRSADELLSKANGELYNQVQGVLEDGRRGLREFAEAGQRANTLMAEAAPEVRLTVANASLASNQLKLLMAEVRRNPWRLLYQPGKKELEAELVYEASRNYAQAVGELRGVSASLDAVAGVGDDPQTRQRAIELREQLTGSYDRYKQAEDAFLKILLGQEKK